jgi:hypothetical protein
LAPIAQWVAAHPPVPGTQRWEYAYLHVPWRTADQHQRMLNLMGSGGWELVGYQYAPAPASGVLVDSGVDRGSRYVFKRPAPPPPPAV